MISGVSNSQSGLRQFGDVDVASLSILVVNNSIIAETGDSPETKRVANISWDSLSWMNFEKDPFIRRQLDGNLEKIIIWEVCGWGVRGENRCCLKIC